MNGVAVGLDFGAVMTMGAAREADLEMLADVLPFVESRILAAMRDDAEGSGEGSE